MLIEGALEAFESTTSRRNSKPFGIRYVLGYKRRSNMPETEGIQQLTATVTASPVQRLYPAGRSDSVLAEWLVTCSDPQGATIATRRIRIFAQIIPSPLLHYIGM
jgi:hypothetical protein